MKKCLIVVVLICSVFACKKDVKPEETDAIKAGQVWSYNNRVGEDQSTLQILKIDDFNDKGIVYHIAVSGLTIKNPANENGVSNDISHLPLSKKALESSLKTLVEAKKDLPKFNKEYTIWKKAFLSQKAGVFDTSVKETINLVEQMLQERK